MARVIAIANQKGGVGKTTTSVNLSAALAQNGQRVLLVDLDPQGNATTGSGLDKRTPRDTVYQVLIGACRPDQAVVAAGAGGYSLLSANRELAGAELDLVELSDRERRLAQALDVLDEHFDQVVIDCPPSLSLLTLNGLCSARDVIIPMQCEYYALEGLSDLVNTLRKVRANFNPDLDILGLLRVMFDPRMALAQQVAAQLEQHFGAKVFSTVIPRNVRLAEAPSHGQPGVLYDPGSKGAQAYLAFARELLNRISPAQTDVQAKPPKGDPQR
jgi:chromosome partitioning protein